MYSHHSHSSSYSQHGASSLEEMVARANNLDFKLFCLTEHVPRKKSKYLYPEEIHNFNNPLKDIEKLEKDFDRFVHHSKKIKDRYDKEFGMKIIIGTEIESCDYDQIMYCHEIMNKYNKVIKFCVGSVHHVNGIPIDFDQDNWNKSVKNCNNNLRQFIKNYYETQYEMLTILKPIIVGHFDLYKLFLPTDLEFDKVSGQIKDDENRNLKLNQDMVTTVAKTNVLDLWEDVRNLVIRNLKFIGSYGGLLEINTSGLRKKLAEPYPSKDVCKLAQKYCQGRFVLSDDSHSVDQIGTCYPEAMRYITQVLKLSQMYYLNERENGTLEAIPYNL